MGDERLAVSNAAASGGPTATTTKTVDITIPSPIKVETNDQATSHPAAVVTVAAIAGGEGEAGGATGKFVAQDRPMKAVLSASSSSLMKRRTSIAGMEATRGNRSCLACHKISDNLMRCSQCKTALFCDKKCLRRAGHTKRVCKAGLGRSTWDAWRSRWVAGPKLPSLSAPVTSGERYLEQCLPHEIEEHVIRQNNEGQAYIEPIPLKTMADLLHKRWYKEGKRWT